MAKEKSGRGRRRIREKGYQGVEDFRFINFIIFFFFFLRLYFIIFFYTLFTHYVYPHPRPTTHDPRHLATLAFQTTIKSHCWSFKPRIWQLSHYALSIWHCQGCFPWLWLEIGCVTPSGKGPIYSLSSTRIKCVFYCVKYFWRWR